MTEIEFLDPGPEADAAAGAPDPDERPAFDLRRLWPTLAVAVGWLAAAGLAVGASLAVVYRLSYQGPGAPSISVDAWGRYDSPQLAGAIGHAPRYAILLVAAAVLLVAAALTSVARPVVARYLGGVGVGAAAVAAGAVYLQVDSTRSTYSARARALTNESDATVQLHVGFGAATWLAAGAAVLALAGLAIALFLRPAVDGPDPAGPEAAGPEAAGTDAARPEAAAPQAERDPATEPPTG